MHRASVRRACVVVFWAVAGDSAGARCDDPAVRAARHLTAGPFTVREDQSETPALHTRIYHQPDLISLKLLPLLCVFLGFSRHKNPDSTYLWNRTPLLLLPFSYRLVSQSSPPFSSHLLHLCILLSFISIVPL